MSSPDEFVLVVDDGLCKRKFVLYFCFVTIFFTFCGLFYYLTRRSIFRLYICITNSHATRRAFSGHGGHALSGEVTGTAWLPSCDVISARQCSYPVRALSGGDDVAGRQAGCGGDFAR